MSWRRILSCLVLRFFHRSSPKLPRLDMISPQCKQVLDFLVMSKNKIHKWCKNLWFCCERCNIKCNCINDLMLMLCLQPAILLNIKFPHTCFLLNFANFFIVSLYGKWDPGTGVSLRILIIFLAFNFAENKAPAH